MSDKAENTSYLVDNNWSQSLEGMIGKFTVAPTPYAQLVWELVKKYPDRYCFGFSHVEDEKTGDKELVGISLIQAPHWGYRDIEKIIGCDCSTCSGYCGCGIKGHHSKKPSVEG